MKQIKINTLALRNFKGISDFTIALDGDNAAIYGDNSTGKTSLYDGFLWLLFGKDSLNRADFEIKTLNKAGAPVHNLNHEVEGLFSVDGKPLTLRKVYAEKWTKKRGGGARPEFTGHVTDHFIDGVPVKKNEYEAAISALVDEGIFRLLTNPRHFTEILHWQKCRDILLTVCGDISDADVIATDKSLATLPDVLGNRALDDHRKVIEARRKAINGELQKLPVRIDEAARSLPDVEGLNAKQIQDAIAKLEADRTAKQKELAVIEHGGHAAELTKQLREIEGQIQEAYNTAQGDQRKAIKAKQDESDQIYKEIQKKQRDADSLREAITAAKTRVRKNTEEMEALRQSYRKIEAEQFNPGDIADICPTCKQDIPADQVEAARVEAKAQWNEAQAEKLARINADGKILKADVKRFTFASTSNTAELETIQAQIDKLNAAFAALEIEIDNMNVPIVVPPGLIQKRDKLEAEIAKHKSGDNQGAREALSEEMEFIKNQITALQGHAAAIETAKATKARIADLEAQEKTLAEEYERLEAELYLCETFTRSKVKLLEEKINARFKLARFKLFSEQVNGGLAECCDVTHNGVPYGSMNNAARIQCGLDIIKTLSEHHGLACPIFLDNRESVVEIPEMAAQVISLIVSEKDKALRVETVSNAAKRAA